MAAMKLLQACPILADEPMAQIHDHREKASFSRA
jgi:hypothetical protein